MNISDQLTYIAVKDRRFYPVFKYTFCPTYHFIDRATGYFNSAMGFKKDYAAILNSLWDVSKTVTSILESSGDIDENKLRLIGADIDSEDRDEIIDSIAKAKYK